MLVLRHFLMCHEESTLHHRSLKVCSVHPPKIAACLFFDIRSNQSYEGLAAGKISCSIVVALAIDSAIAEIHLVDAGNSWITRTLSDYFHWKPSRQRCSISESLTCNLSLRATERLWLLPCT
jgi:hypothetical protein